MIQLPKFNSCSADGTASVNREDSFMAFQSKTAFNTRKSPEDILQEELLKERAAVLGRAGESVSRALDKLRTIEASLEQHLSQFRDLERSIAQDKNTARQLGEQHRQMLQEINREICKYNGAREYAALRHHYLIVTREAMGIRRHHWVEQHYRVPPRKKHLQDG
jgi:hypothetical protein